MWFGGQISKMFLRKFDQLIVWYTASTNQNHPVCRVVLLDVVDKVITLYACDIFLWSKNGSA